MSHQDCTVNQHWDKTFELPNTSLMPALLDCQIMNIYYIMKMWWHLKESHLTLSSRASVSLLSTNAFCSKERILKDSGRNVSRSRRCLRAGVISDRFLFPGKGTHTKKRLFMWGKSFQRNIKVNLQQHKPYIIQGIVFFLPIKKDPKDGVYGK